MITGDGLSIVGGEAACASCSRISLPAKEGTGIYFLALVERELLCGDLF
jgi:hypothetical protein